MRQTAGLPYSNASHDIGGAVDSLGRRTSERCMSLHDGSGRSRHRRAMGKPKLHAQSSHQCPDLIPGNYSPMTMPLSFYLPGS